MPILILIKFQKEARFPQAGRRFGDEFIREDG
jgi:hypothetical protein